MECVITERSFKKYIDEIIYFKRACCKECSNKYRSLLQLGENNTCYRMTEDTRTLSHKKQGESLREKIRNNEFTPAITNSYCHSKYNVIY